jgi:hypothetical protein
MFYRTLNIEQHKPHWKQTMIYTTLHRTLNIEQYKPHWKQTMSGLCCSMFSVLFCRLLFVFSVVYVAQCLVFCVVLCRSLFVFSVVCVTQCLVFCSVDYCLFLVEQNTKHWVTQTTLKTNNDLHNTTQNTKHWATQTPLKTNNDLQNRTLNIEQHKPHLT